MTVIVALIAVLCVGVLSLRGTLTDFQEYVTKVEETDLERVRDVFTESYERSGSWYDAQSVLNQIGKLTGKQLLLVDSQRNVVAAYPAELSQFNFQITSDHNVSWTRELIVGNEIRSDQLFLQKAPHIILNDSSASAVGILYIAPFLPKEGFRDEDIFINSLIRTLLLAGIASTFVALLIAFFLSRRILRPIRALTEAVQQMETGNLSQRLEASSKNEIGKLTHAFNSMADNLKRVEQLRRNLVSDVAHELRTPLTNIRCQIETIQDGLRNPTPEVINSLYEETMLLNHLVDDLQDIALAEAGQLSLKLERISVKNVVMQAVNSLPEQNGKDNPFIKIEIPENLPDVFADSKRLRQVIRNLLDNAITHTPSTGKITIQASQIDSHVEMIIEDTGIGIAEKDLPFVFERFYRTDTSRARATGGSGLGLAIVKQIIEAQKGKISIESQLGKGTKIYFTLPVFNA